MERRVRSDIFGDPWFKDMDKDSKLLYLFLLQGPCLPNTTFIHMNNPQIADKLSLETKFVYERLGSWARAGIIIQTKNYVCAIKHNTIRRFTPRDNRTRSAKVELREVARENQHAANLWRQQFFPWESPTETDDYLAPQSDNTPTLVEYHSDLTKISLTESTQVRSKCIEQQDQSDSAVILDADSGEVTLNTDTTIQDSNIIDSSNLNININKYNIISGNSDLFADAETKPKTKQSALEEKRAYYNQLIAESLKQLPANCLASWNNLVTEMKFKRGRKFVEPTLVYDLLQDILASIERWQWQPDEINMGLRACTRASQVAENERYFRKAAMSYRIRNAEQHHGGSIIIGEPSRETQQAIQPDLTAEMDVWRKAGG